MTEKDNSIIGHDDLILVTGASGFIGSKVVKALLRRGFRNLRCLVRSAQGVQRLEAAVEVYRAGAHVEVLHGNLVYAEDCAAAVRDAAVIYHLAAGRGEKAIPDAFLNTVVATRNLLEATLQRDCLKRFVNTSSFVVYDVTSKRGHVLDESCPTELHPESCNDAYEFSKAKKDKIIHEYVEKHKIPTVIVRPGYVYGPGIPAISGRVGIGSFGLFLHLGGSNLIPLSYVDNCADAIVLAGLTPGIEGEVFNIVDDDLPSSRKFLRLYKSRVRKFRSLYLPHVVSYFLCLVWEKYSAWSSRQLPPAFSRKMWYKYWKKTKYSNEKVKTVLGWLPEVPMTEGLRRYFESCRASEDHA